MSIHDDAAMDAIGTGSIINPRAIINVFVLDDHDVVVRGLVDLIESQDDMTVIGTAATEREAVGRIARLRPDVAILDVRLLEGCGLNVCRSVTNSQPSVASVMLTSIDDQRVLVEAAAAGAAGFCHKGLSAANIVETVRAVAGGAKLIDPAAIAVALDALDRASDPALAQLNEQEQQIVALIGRGWSNRQIGFELILAEKTVKNYVSRLLGKLGMSRRAEVAALAGRLAERQSSWESLTGAGTR